MATAPDISKLSYSDLQKLIAQAQEAVEAKRDEELKVLADGYAKKCAAAGFTPEEAMEALRPYMTPKKTRRSGGGAQVVRYRDPKSGETWSGRGRMARWLQAHVDAGKKKEDFLVK